MVERLQFDYIGNFDFFQLSSVTIATTELYSVYIFLQVQAASSSSTSNSEYLQQGEGMEKEEEEEEEEGKEGARTDGQQQGGRRGEEVVKQGAMARSSGRTLVEMEARMREQIRQLQVKLKLHVYMRVLPHP